MNFNNFSWSRHYFHDTNFGISVFKVEVRTATAGTPLSTHGAVPLPPLDCFHASAYASA